MEEQHPLKSEKSFATAVILSGIFGLMGIHHFYVKRWAMGFLDLGLFAVTLYFYATFQLGLALIFFAIDLVHTVLVTYQLLTGQYKDGDGKYVCYPGQPINHK